MESEYFLRSKDLIKTGKFDNVDNVLKYKGVEYVITRMRKTVAQLGDQNVPSITIWLADDNGHMEYTTLSNTAELIDLQIPTWSDHAFMVESLFASHLPKWQLYNMLEEIDEENPGNRFGWTRCKFRVSIRSPVNEKHECVLVSELLEWIKIDSYICKPNVVRKGVPRTGALTVMATPIIDFGLHKYGMSEYAQAFRNWLLMNGSDDEISLFNQAMGDVVITSQGREPEPCMMQRAYVTSSIQSGDNDAAELAIDVLYTPGFTSYEATLAYNDGWIRLRINNEEFVHHATTDYISSTHLKIESEAASRSECDYMESEVNLFPDNELWFPYTIKEYESYLRAKEDEDDFA